MAHCRSNSQTALIMAHLRENGSISPREALDRYGCMRLASRINDLKKAGAEIKRDLVYYIDEDGNKRRYAKYSLEE